MNKEFLRIEKGFSVDKAIELGLDIKDLAILRMFENIRKSGKMTYHLEGDIKYYWANYSAFEKELSFFGIGTKTIGARFKKMEKVGLVIKKLIRIKKTDLKENGSAGTYSCIALGEKYFEFVNYVKNHFESLKQQSNSANDLCQNESIGVAVKRERGLCSQMGKQKNNKQINKTITKKDTNTTTTNSILDKIKKTVIKETPGNIADEFVVDNNTLELLKENFNDDLNAYNRILDLIKMRKISFEYLLEKLNIVKNMSCRNFVGALISALKNNWVTKQTSILNNNTVMSKNSNNKPSNFANFTQRQYNYEKLEAQLLGWADSNDDDYEIGTIEPAVACTTANFTQRQYDYDKLEEQLLGWS